MKDRNLPVDDNWITPEYIYDPLCCEFGFDFDPCPYNVGEIDDSNNGLLNVWGQSNFVNPPYQRFLKEAFVSRAVMFQRLGKLSVLLLPVSTSTVLFHDVILPNASEPPRFLRKRIKFQKRDPDGRLYTPKNGGMHDSMLIILKPQP